MMGSIAKNPPGRRCQIAVTWIVCVGALLLGLGLRYWHWSVFSPVRRATLDDAMEWGGDSTYRGYLNIYSDTAKTLVAAQRGGFSYSALDYPPLRLAVFAIWSKWLNRDAIGPAIYAYENTQPLLIFNTAMEEAGALAAFLLVRHSLRRAKHSQATRLALAAAILLWLNPALMMNSWGWPAWDVWILPFYLFAVLLASTDWWLMSGVTLGIGAMFKGQEALVIPLFVFWPLFDGRPISSFRWVAGFALAWAIIASPWLLTRPVLLGGQTDRVLDYGAVLWVLSAVLASVGVSQWQDWRHRGAICALVTAAAVFACSVFFGGTMDWYRVAFMYGADKFSGLTAGGPSNLASILQFRFHCGASDPLWTVRPHILGSWPRTQISLTLSTVLVSLCTLAVLGCSASTGYLHRQRNRRFLVAIAAPWLMVFALAPRMHGRYLMWAAGISAVVTGVDMRLVLLVLLLSVISWLDSFVELLSGSSSESLTFGRDVFEFLFRFAYRFFPEMGWMVLLCATVFMYYTIWPARRHEP